MANQTKIIIPLILILLLLSAISLINLSNPTEVKAGPLAGFTPSPPDPPDPPEPPDKGSKDRKSDSSDNKPTDFVYVQIDRCHLSCSVNSPRQQGELLASISNDQVYSSLLASSTETAPAAEIQAPVRLIHQGSGFIVEGILSDHRGTRFPVPYGDQWEVWLTELPQSADSMVTANTDLAQLQAQLVSGPVSLGLVIANTIEPQVIKCPVACVIEAPPASPALPLPQTGSDQVGFSALPWLLIFGGLLLSLIGASWLLASRPAGINRPESGR